MLKGKILALGISGACAGAVAGLFGAGGGLILIPLLSLLTDIPESKLFSSSLAIVLPICIVCLIATAMNGGLPIQTAIPYLIGSAAGGVCAGIWGHRIPAIWLHRCLGILILWGGYRYLC